MDLFMNVALICLVLMVIGTGFMYDLHSSESIISKIIFLLPAKKLSIRRLLSLAALCLQKLGSLGIGVVHPHIWWSP